MSTPDQPDRPDDRQPSPPAHETGEHPADETAPGPATHDAGTAPAPAAAPADGTAPAPGTAGAHAAPRPAPGTRDVPSSGQGAVVEEDLRTGAPTRTYDAATAHPPAAPPAATSAGPVGTGTTAVGTTGAAAPGASVPPAHTSGGDVRPDRRTAGPDAPERADAEALEPPSKPGFGRHVLGVVVGLVLTPFAFLLTGIGAARLADIAGTSRMGTDTLGVVLLALGVLLLAVLVLLGAWTATVPITGGIVWGLGLGVAYLVAPRDLEATVENASGGTVPAAMDQFAQSAMSGMLLLVGVLLLAAGIAAAVARGAGRRYGWASAEHVHARERLRDPGR